MLQYEWYYFYSFMKSEQKIKIDEKVYSYYEKWWPLKYILLDFVKTLFGRNSQKNDIFCNLILKIIQNHFQLIFFKINDDMVSWEN